ncbi:Hint domain-containing protein [Phaeobacter sp. BS34]
MLLDHSTSFADCQPVGLLLDFPAAVSPAAPSRARPRPRTGGLLPHVMVETDRGFVQARNVKPGDKIYTLDGGAQEVTGVKHAVPRLTSLVHVPAGALGNDDDLMLLKRIRRLVWNCPQWSACSMCPPRSPRWFR